jgi:metallo-beta-lactamase family protein
MASEKILITFAAGAGTVTGANFLVEGAGKKFLVDCGLVQSEKLADDFNWQPFPYDAKKIDTLFVTHAHIDHVGRIPKLYHDGFRGKIISSIPTMDLAVIMLEDTINILGHDKGSDLQKMYNKKALTEIMQLWEGVEMHEPFQYGPFKVNLKDAGHILGSCMYEFMLNGKKLVFTGDLGNSPSPLLPDTEAITDADYMIMESVYGDRNHEARNERKKLLESYLEDNYKRKGTLVIPTFSLERTQELLYEINDLVENHRIPPMPIFLDSPLGIHLTSVYQKHSKYFNTKARDLISKGDNIFSFPGLKLTTETQESKNIFHAPNPKIVIAGSGMSNGGRVIHHELNYLPDKNNTLLLTGYQSMGTLGRHIEDGDKTVRILHEDVPVKANIAKISGYSGHKDSDNLVDFVQNTAETLKKLFVCMGEPKSSMFLAQRLRDNLGINAYPPKAGEKIEIEL